MVGEINPTKPISLCPLMLPKEYPLESAYDRTHDPLLGDPDTRPDELVQPGHIFPLKAKDGGVLERAGHTEAAIDLASLAGLSSAAAILNDGSMARTQNWLLSGAVWPENDIDSCLDRVSEQAG